MKLVIFGCGKIANRIAKSCKLVKEIDLCGFASRDIDKAKEYAEKYDCREYGDYDHFLNSDIDAVYVATYNGSHHELIENCLKQHKNVICEKPMLFSVKENEEMFDLAKENNVLLMEAMKAVFLPVNIKVKELIEKQAIGKINKITASFMRKGNHGDDHWINDLICGGAFKDLGSYCVGTINYLLERQGKLISLESDRRSDKAETTAFAKLDYDGIEAEVSVSNSKDGDMSLTVYGERGMIKVNEFWKSGKGYYIIDDVKYELDEELISDFYYELKHFADLVDRGIKESDIMSRRASSEILRITEQI